MKRYLALIALACMCTPVLADEPVRGHVRKDGTYVEPHYRSSPNQYRFDNYSSSGNSNPYTGQRGYERNEFTDPPAYNKPRSSNAPSYPSNSYRDPSRSRSRGY